MDASSGLPPIAAIFLAEFHPTQGPRIAAQVPAGFVRSPAGAFTFSPTASLAGTLVPGRASGRSTPGSGTPGIARPASPDPFATVDPYNINVDPNQWRGDAEAAAALALQRFPSIASHAGSITTGLDDSEPPPTPHLDFDAVTEFVIPKAENCNRLLAVSARRWRLLGHAVMIESPKYPRNALIFNCCFVFERDADTRSFDAVVEKVARVFRAVELESEFISKPRPEISVQNILEELIEDLNKYRECRIPIGGYDDGA